MLNPTIPVPIAVLFLLRDAMHKRGLCHHAASC